MERSEKNIKLNELQKAIGIKKRTLIFWTDEYGLNKYVIHHKSGNRYTEKAVFYIKLISMLKESSLFMSNFIKIYIDLLDKTGKIPELPVYLKELEFSLLEIQQDFNNGCIISTLLLPDQKELFSNDSDSHAFKSRIEDLEKTLREKPENEDEILMEIAEIYRTKLSDYANALMYYHRITQDESSQYAEIARIFQEILEGTVQK